MTINHPTEDCINGLDVLDALSVGCAACRETGANGNRHLHVYLKFKNAKSFNAIKKQVPRARIEIARGNEDQALEYIQKEDEDVYISGNIGTKQGQRTDIDKAIELVKEKGLETVAEELPRQFVYYHRGLSALQARLIPPRSAAPRVTVRWGTTGTGKSYCARESMGHERYYVWGPEMGKWFDGYEGHSNVIMEEFRGQLPFGMLLRLLDRYDCRVEYKGGSIPFVAENIVITSPKHPSEWYVLDDLDKYDQLTRRITEVIHHDTLHTGCG